MNDSYYLPGEPEIRLAIYDPSTGTVMAISACATVYFEVNSFREAQRVTLDMYDYRAMHYTAEYFDQFFSEPGELEGGISNG